MEKSWTIAESYRAALLDWFRHNQRPLPWRENRDPYRIWISETMLQQTTTTAVIPFFEKFMERFPSLRALADASEPEVKRYWAGLGYYSRATNLWKAARLLAQEKAFPESHGKLLAYPGFGPYTARAVASLAFGEEVGVLDGNVIRVLSRYLNQSIPWWKTAERHRLQNIVDGWVKNGPSHEINQALMELGATICTPKSPACLLCPLQKSCGALKAKTVSELPLARPRREREIWLWRPRLYSKNRKIGLVPSRDLPFLKNHWVLPGPARRLKSRPKSFDFSHSITHHDIFVAIEKNRALSREEMKAIKWFDPDEVTAHAPSSLVKKALSRL